MVLNKLPRNIKVFTSKILTKYARILLESGFQTSAQPEINGEYWFLRNHNIPLEYIIDGGANQGEWTKYLLKYNLDFKKLILIEPNKLLSKKLNKTYEKDDRIHIVDIGLDYRNDKLSFNIPREGHPHGSFSTSLFSSNSHCEYIQTTTIDNLINELELEFIDLIKLDLEGFDHYALLGARQSLAENKIKIIQFEVTRCWEDASNSPCSTFRLLRKANFDIYWLSKDKLIPINDISNLTHFSLYSNFIAIHNNLDIVI